MNDYIKNNSGILSTTKTSKINPSFFDNIINNSIQKKSKIKEVLIKISQKNNQIILKNYFLKWNTIKKELISTVADNSLDLDKHNTILNNNEAKVKEMKDENQKNNEKEIQDSNNNQFKEIKNEKNNVPPYDDIMNNSIKINDKENNKKDNSEELKDNKMNDLDNQIIDDDFDIKLNEEMILNQKENSKIKSDIFDSNDINISSNYLKDKSNINENILNNSQDKTKNPLKREITETNNEICNISNTNTNTQKESTVLNSHQEQNENIEIKNIKSNEENLINFEKNENEKQNHSEINKIRENREKFKEEIRKTFTKNILFDSLENKESYNDFSFVNNNKNKNEHSLKMNNTHSNIGSKKMKILNHFMTENPIKEKISAKNNNPKKRCFYKISSTNNIFIKNDDNIISNKKEEKSSFNDTNLTKIENIFIQGNNNNKTSADNTQRKKLELLTIDKNNDIYIGQNKKENKKELNKNYDLLLKNNIYERLIDSNMITNFLNNTKNEPMFNKKKYATIQYPNEYSKINLNINNIINFSINKSTPKIKTEENNNLNKNKNVSFNTFKNNFVYERKNNFYLKKQLNKGNKKLDINQDIKRANSNRITNKNNLKLNELELMEPNVQICPVSLRQKQNNFYEEQKSDGIKNDNVFIKIKKEYKTITINKKKRRLPKSLSTELINDKLLDRKTTSKDKYGITYNLNKIKLKNKNNKTTFISEDLLNFIDCIKVNQYKEKQKSNQNIQTQKNDVYNFKEIKYNKINTYREKNKKENKNSSLIVDSFKRIYNYKLNNYNNSGIRKETDKNNNTSVGKQNKNRNVDYKRLNELYLDYKVKDIKRIKLKNKQDNDEGITFVPHINKFSNKNLNKF